MKGTLYKTEEGWFVGNAKHSELPLHPDNVKICNQYGDYSIDWDSKEVEFEIVQEQYGDAFHNFTSYAKLINHSVDTNEMIDHISDVSKMVCMFEPRTDTSSATICKHCGKEKFLHDHVPDVGKMRDDDYLEDDLVKLVISEWNEYEERTGNPPYMYHLGFTEGYNKAKETLYTEEEVEKLLLTQRGNCYVAVLTSTQDERLASTAGGAPEPWNWKKTT